jgi:hypothetical protein
MRLTLQQAPRLRLAILCEVCGEDAPSVNGLVEEDQDGALTARAWKAENDPTEIEYFVWLVANGHCPACRGKRWAGQTPDDVITKWMAHHTQTRTEGI